MTSVGFFNPISWGWDKISGYVKEEVVEWISSILGWLVTWVLSGVSWIMAFVAELVTNEALQPPDLSAEWFARGVYATMQELGAYGAVIGFVIAVAASVIAADFSSLFKRTLLQTLKWGFFTGLFLEGAGIAQQAMAAAERAVGGSGLGGNAAELFGSFESIADAASASGALAGIMAIFTGVVLIAGAIVMIALKVVVNALFVVMALFGPLVAVALFSKRPEMLGRYLTKLAALALAPFMMTASLAVGASLVMATIGGAGFSATLPPPPTDSSEPVDVLSEQKKAEEAATGEEASAGLLVVSMISALGVMIVTILSPAAPAALVEFSSDTTVRSAGRAAVGVAFAAGSVATMRSPVATARQAAFGSAGHGGGGALATLMRGGGSAPRGTTPPRSDPPGNSPPGSAPPGNAAPGNAPGSQPPGSEPPGNAPPGTSASASGSAGAAATRGAGSP